jgi:predicted house-cleaning noncanonical NTP pyrophosphatase (MazG superfamily)
MHENELPLILDQEPARNWVPQRDLKATYGIKGVGLLKLPLLWTPPFFLLATGLYSRFQDVARNDRAPLIDALLTEEERNALQAALREVEPDEDGWIIVRSSAGDEDLDRRGRYKSKVCKATVRGLADAALHVFNSCSVEEATTMGLIIQSYVPLRRASGHLSNERRVSRRPSSWMCEFDSVSGAGSPRIRSISSSRFNSPDSSAGLLCSDIGSLNQLLSSITAWAYSAGGPRIHFEWVWDGVRLWIVQADPIADIVGEPPSALRWPKTRCEAPPSLSILIPERQVEEGRWSKLDCVKVFRACGLPTTSLWVLSDRETLAQLREGECSSNLQRDLQSLLAAPVVIRTDVGGPRDIGKLMLARTNTVHSLEMAIEFLKKTTLEVARHFGDAADFCFIIHRFIPARSSAWGLAAPDRSRVRIDGIWGLPDGLSFYPHDSYDLPRDGGRIESRIRYKREYLDVDPRGEWIPKSIGRPLDWRPSLEEPEVRTIAAGTFSVASRVNSPVEVMWFVGIPFGTGHPACLPWYFGEVAPPDVVVGHSAGIQARGSLIRKPDDLESLRCEIKEDQNVSLIRLRPLPEFLRAREFIEDVASVARQLSIPVLIEGSVLSHAYYILRRCGVNVLCADAFGPRAERREFNKLVRDRIPVKIRSRGERVTVIRLPREKLSSILRSKLVEESLELFWAETPEQTKEETADVLEVIRAICEQERIKEDDLRALADQKRESRGGFTEGIVLKETQEVPIVRVAQETADLFDEVEPLDAQKEEVRLSESQNVQTGPVPHLDGPRIIVPLIPPNPEERHFGHFFQFVAAGVLVNIRFEEKEIVVELEPAGKRKDVSGSTQLKFPFDHE